eukprot:TCALIF_12769-PA protein Name:"Protein of unknown function" AED:0.15 eAED:0.15 QI:185/0.5/1/1/0.5/0.33/3/0/106
MDQDESDLVFVLDAPSVGDNSKHLGSKKARPELATMCLSGTPKISNSKRFQIQGSYEVHVRNVGLVFDHHHRLELERISSKVVFTGNISCSECANQTRSSSMKSEL